MHDDTLDRTTNGSGAISDYTLDDLSQFQIDYGNYLDTNENLKIPTINNEVDIGVRVEVPNSVKEIRARNSIIPVMTIGYTPAPYTDNLERITEISENRGILYNYPQVDQAAIDILHQQNIFCGVWSVDDTETAQKYIDYGVDFIVTNDTHFLFVIFFVIPTIQSIPTYRTVKHRKFLTLVQVTLAVSYSIFVLPPNASRVYQNNLDFREEVFPPFS